MLTIDSLLLKEELNKSLKKPFRLPINLAIAAAGTLASIFIGILINTFHRGLPYIAANVFIWTLATYNASQLGSDSNKVLAYLDKQSSIKQLFLVKNVSLLILAIPIDIVLVIVACVILHDWSSFPQAIVLGLSAVIICLGFGNIVSTLWAYNPVSILKIRHDRVQMFEYSVFITLAYVSATFSLLIAAIPAGVIAHNINVHAFPGTLIGFIIIACWTGIIWGLTLKISVNITKKYYTRLSMRLSGKPVEINSPRLKKILKVK